MNELSKLVELSKSPDKIIQTIDFPEIKQYTNKTPTYNPKKYFNNYFYQCNCLYHGKKVCHCNHYHCHHHIHHNLSCLNMRNPINKYKLNLFRNKSMNNLINYDYNIREIDPQKIYYINYNENSNSNIKKYNDNTNNSNHQLYIDKNLKENGDNNDNIIYDYNYYYNSQNNKNENENNNNIDNHKYHNIVHKNKEKEDVKEGIKEKNIENNKKEIKPANSPQISRREVARYFHIVNPRKYSYEKEAQYADNNDNHRYKEIHHIDGQEDKIILKSRPKNKKFNNSININNNNTEVTSNVYYRYRTTENSQKYFDPITIDSTNEQLKSPQIVKETFNTRLVNSKSFKKSPSEKAIFNPKNQLKYVYNLNNLKNNNFDYNKEPNLNSNSKNFTFNSYNEYDDSDGLQMPNNYNNYNNYNNSKLKYKQFYEEKYDSNSHIKPTNNYNFYKISTIRNNNNNSIYNNNINNNKIPITFSSTNLYKNKLSNPRTIQIEHNYSSNNNNIQKMIPPNIDYNTLKQTVKLAVLKKQMKEEEKRKNLKNGNGYNNVKNFKNKKKLKNILLNEYNGVSKNIDDNLTILERTKKLLEKDKYKNGNIYNHKNDYNRNILKDKTKIWKP